MGRLADATAGSSYRGGGRSPVGIGGAVAIHGVAVAIFLLMPAEMIRFADPWKPLTTTAIPIEKTPPEVTPEEQDPKPTQRTIDQPTRTDPVIPVTSDSKLDPGPATEPGDRTGTGGDIIILPPPPKVADPVFVEAGIDPRARGVFQPDYPGAMIRQSQEGTVTVRVQIGTDGRVTDIEKISATDDAFWLATQRHALRKWRFRPATRDGVPVPTAKVLTVHFRLEDR